MAQKHIPDVVQKELQEIALIHDKLGKTIDEGIRLTVAALRAHGFTTSQSCEGHLDRKTIGPWVDIESSKAQDLLKTMQDGPHSGPELQQNRRNLVNANELEQDRLFGLLNEFYTSHQQSYEIILTITEWGPGWGRLCSHAGRFMKLAAHDDNYEQWLKDAQAEMAAFAEFLCSILVN